MPSRPPAIPGYDAIIGPDNAAIGEILKQNGYATSWFGKNHNTPGYEYSLSGPFDQWPSGMGFEYFYGFMGGETDQWRPWLFRDHTQIFPWVGNPGYNLITGMADDAISHLKGLNAAAPDQPFFVYYAPGGSHAPHQPTPEWIKKISDMHLFDKGWNESARTDFRQSEAARRDPAEYQAYALAGRATRIRRSQAREMGHAQRRGKEALHPPGGCLCRLRGLYRQ